MDKKIAIVGMGHVGKGMQKIFPEAWVLDPPRGLGVIEDLRGADLVIVCVPTPKSENGECDTSIVRQVVNDLDELDVHTILIKSTVPPGITKNLDDRSLAHVVFSPEYMGESTYWTPPQFPDPKNPLSHGFVILGGQREACEHVADIMLPRMGPGTRFRFMSSTEAEIVKYSENAFFALKVTFANMMRELAEAHGASYHTIREGWLDDPRIGPMFSAAFKEQRGFSGKCLPKDIAALAEHCRRKGVRTQLLDAVISTNAEGEDHEEASQERRSSSRV